MWLDIFIAFFKANEREFDLLRKEIGGHDLQLSFLLKHCFEELYLSKVIIKPIPHHEFGQAFVSFNKCTMSVHTS